MSSLFEKEIQELKGVGEKRVKLFQKLGVPTVGALLRFYPRNYENWSCPLPIDRGTASGGLHGSRNGSFPGFRNAYPTGNGHLPDYCDGRCPRFDGYLF